MVQLILFRWSFYLTFFNHSYPIRTHTNHTKLLFNHIWNPIDLLDTLQQMTNIKKYIETRGCEYKLLYLLYNMKLMEPVYTLI